MSRYVAFGSAGCGKTEFGQRVVTEFIKSGTRKDEVAFVAFNREAAATAMRRCGISLEEKRDLWFRTLHSACLRTIPRSEENEFRVMGPSHKRKFNKEYGIKISEEGGEDADSTVEDVYWQLFKSAPDRDNPGDQYLSWYSLSRLCCSNAAELDEVVKEPHPKAYEHINADPKGYAGFVAIYEDFKKREGLIDFIDMIARVARGQCIRPKKFKLVLIDEAMDLSPLMNKAADYLFYENAEEAFRLGDDFQAIYNWMGADARDFLAYRDNAKVILLEQTYRFGKDIVDLGRRITDRLDFKQEKNIVPKDGMTHDVRVEYQFDPKALDETLAERKALILHRHVAGCREVGDRLIQAGVPFWNERGVNPIARDKERHGWMAFKELCEKKKLTYSQLWDLLSVIPSRKKIEDGYISLVKHGAKKEIQEKAGLGFGKIYEMDDLKGLLMEPMIQSIQKKDPQWLDVQYGEYYDALIERGFDFEEHDPRIRITTIHGSKGREADLVVLFSETFPKAARNPNEHRVAYVGVTRTKRDLWVVRESICGDWTSEYNYPMEGF